MRCCASRKGEGNASKSLPCNDECARLERNRKLAVALNLDPATHVEGGDHIPYSEETLNLYRQHPKWCQKQEREFRVFVNSDDEKRLRFKPMPSSQRTFIHSLAEDFGLDSESMDPEPHRHVAIFKTPRFVSAPNKTLSDSARIRIQQQALVGKEAAEAKQQQQQKANHDVFDAFVLSNTRFGLTADEVQTVLSSATGGSSSPDFEILFLPDDQVLLRPKNSQALAPEALTVLLQTFKPSLGAVVSAASIGNIELCRADSASGSTIRYRESDLPTASALADGWNRVAAKGAAPRRAIATASGPSGAGNAYWALSGNKVTFTKSAAVTTTATSAAKTTKKKKEEIEPVVEDWETAASELEAAQEPVAAQEPAATTVPPDETQTGPNETKAGSVEPQSGIEVSLDAPH